MAYIDFNMNQEVTVKLTSYGRDTLKREFDEMKAAYPKLTHEYSPPKEDENGYSTWQMHNLFSRFGHLVCMGGKLPFETDIKLIINN